MAGRRVVWDSLAIAMAVAERHPDLNFWPADPAARALAMSITAGNALGFHRDPERLPDEPRTRLGGVQGG